MLQCSFPTLLFLIFSTGFELLYLIFGVSSGSDSESEGLVGRFCRVV